MVHEMLVCCQHDEMGHVQSIVSRQRGLPRCAQNQATEDHRLLVISAAYVVNLRRTRKLGSHNEAAGCLVWMTTPNGLSAGRWKVFSAIALRDHGP